MLLRQLADQASGSIFVEWLGVQDVIQLGLCSAVYRWRLFFWLCDALRLFCQSAEQVRDLLLDLRGSRLGAYTLERFLCGRSLWQALLGLALLGGCLE